MGYVDRLNAGLDESGHQVELRAIHIDGDLPREVAARYAAELRLLMSERGGLAALEGILFTRT